MTTLYSLSKTEFMVCNLLLDSRIGEKVIVYYFHDHISSYRIPPQHTEGTTSPTDHEEVSSHIPNFLWCGFHVKALQVASIS